MAGIRAHNRWLVDFCEQFPTRRAGIGQVLFNNPDDTVDDVKWIYEHGLRGGILLSPIPPDVGDYIKPFNHPDYDHVVALRKVWYSGQLARWYRFEISAVAGFQDPPSSRTALLFETALAWLLLSGVFERFPGLRFVVIEQGCTWFTPLLAQLDKLVESARQGDVGEVRFSSDDLPLTRLPSDYVRESVSIGASQPTPSDLAARVAVGPDHFMWGSDYPHDEGTYPYTREHLRQVFEGFSEGELRQILGVNAAKLYGFDLDALAPLAERFGPTVAEIGQPLTHLPENPNQALLQRSLAGVT